MPQTTELAAFSLGAVLLLLALTTGGFKIFGAEMGQVAGRGTRPLAGTVGAALIGFALWHALHGQAISPADASVPHAPPLNIAQGVQVWGEDTKLLDLAPGERTTLHGKDLSDNRPDLPRSGCLGPKFVAYSWQVRDPYPKGGDLEITQLIQGGAHPLIGRGSMGVGQMSVCGEHTFKNNGLDRIKVEVRYGTYVEPTFGDSPTDYANEPTSQSAIDNSVDPLDRRE